MTSDRLRQALPAFEAANRIDAYGAYLLMEKKMLNRKQGTTSLMRALILTAAALLTSAVLAASVPDLPLAVNLAEDARQIAQQRIPLVILFSLPGCSHCEMVRNSYLNPMQRTPAAIRKVVLRQIDVNSIAPLIGFDGRETTHGTFALLHAVRLAPVVMFFDQRGGMLAEPLVGSMLPDFYGAYLENALEESLRRLGNPAAAAAKAAAHQPASGL
jgi:thioredoxin-related protein